MAFGGGTFTAHNKKLPGAYINFISKASATATIGERGYVAMAFDLDWGKDGEIFEVTAEDFITKCKAIFGYDYDHEKLKPLRDLFINTTVLYAYKLNANAVKASNTTATAKCGGTRGNDLKIVIQKNVDDSTKFDVMTYLDTRKVDEQTVKTAAELIDNDYVVFKKNATLTVSAGDKLTGGTNGDEITIANHQTFLDKAEGYAFNILAVASTESDVNQLYANYTKRMRDDYGIKFQAVVYNYSADSEAVINVKNPVTDGSNEASLVYYVAGLQAGTAVNASAMNTEYNGEYTFKTDYTQAELATCIDNGEFVLQRDGNRICVLKDINSLVNVTQDKGDDFKLNQVIRVIDAMSSSIASVFKNYFLGKVGNNADGRNALWSQIVEIYTQLFEIKAIEEFDPETIVVYEGEKKDQVVVDCVVTPVVAMSQLYVTNVVE